MDKRHHSGDTSDFRLVLENVRCFSKRFSESIRPLTLLVGENSAGKSTFLAALAAVTDANSFPGAPAVYQEPFDLGNFDTTATYKGGRAGRVEFFRLGYVATYRGRTHEITATYRDRFGKARLAEFSVENPGAKFHAQVDDTVLKCTLTVGAKPPRHFINAFDEVSSINIDFLRHVIFRGIIKNEDVASSATSSDEMLLRRVLPRVFRGRPMSPIRSEPHRTYDRSGEAFKPEGDHIPFEIARMYQEKGRDFELVRDHLTQFGTESNLFKKLEPKRLGNKPGDPFKIDVTVSGRPANIKDVGYGVSQALPVVVESVMSGASNLMLLQQPEVHLHPRAQAALGTFFCKLVNNSQRHIVIETHSDYLIDRVRREVAKGLIKREMVSLLYFERSHMDTEIYPLELDELGNIKKAPAGYRNFFIKEKMSVLNRAE